VAGEIEAKTAAGRRTVPIIGALAPVLAQHKLATGRDGEALVFGSTAEQAFEPSTIRRRALKAWGWKEIPNPDEQGPQTVWIKAREHTQEPIGLHEARHTFASRLIAAGVNAKAITEAMGHASVTMTFDRYGHLMPDGRDEARSRVDAYLGRSLPAAVE
jgi:integrase